MKDHIISCVPAELWIPHANTSGQLVCRRHYHLFTSMFAGKGSGMQCTWTYDWEKKPHAGHMNHVAWWTCWRTAAGRNESETRSDSCLCLSDNLICLSPISPFAHCLMPSIAYQMEGMRDLTLSVWLYMHYSRLEKHVVKERREREKLLTSSTQFWTAPDSWRDVICCRMPRKLL